MTSLIPTEKVSPPGIYKRFYPSTLIVGTSFPSVADISAHILRIGVPHDRFHLIIELSRRSKSFGRQ